LKLEKDLGAHSDYVGALSDDGEGPEWSGHVRAVMAGLRPDAGKTAVAMDASGRGGAQERDGCVGRICVARGGLTKATASSGAAMAAETEGKKNAMQAVLSIYRAMKTTLQRRVASHERAGARADSRGRAWKAFEDRRRRREVAPCG
jgi:hypothetical protein